MRAGFEFNFPLRVGHGHAKLEEVRDLMASFKLSADSDGGLVLDTIKRGEDDEDVLAAAAAAGGSSTRSGTSARRREGKSVVLRVYDSLGGKARGTIESGCVRIKKAWRCNLLEDDEEEVALGSRGEIAVELRGFEVGSWRLLLA